MINHVLITIDEEGRKLVVLPQIIFKNRRMIAWKEVEKYLLKYVGEMIEISGSKDLVYIGRDFADEFTSSEYTQRLKGGTAKAKANLSQGILELVEIATNKRWSEDFRKKHKSKAENGWYRFDSRFALPTTDEEGAVTGYNIYKATLIIRFAADGKMYLYDIQNIKKETSKPPQT